MKLFVLIQNVSPPMKNKTNYIVYILNRFDIVYIFNRLDIVHIDLKSQID